MRMMMIMMRMMMIMMRMMMIMMRIMMMMMMVIGKSRLEVISYLLNMILSTSGILAMTYIKFIFQV